jgi:hypothetical protein
MQDTNAYKLLAILQSHAPTGKDQVICANVYNRTPEVEQERTMVNALADGLNYGNWPWIINKEDRFKNRK